MYKNAPVLCSIVVSTQLSSAHHYDVLLICDTSTAESTFEAPVFTGQNRNLTGGVGDWSMKAAEVDEAVGTQEEVGDQGCNCVQLSCNDTGVRNQKQITNPELDKGNHKLMKTPWTVFSFLNYLIIITTTKIHVNKKKNKKHVIQ